MKKKSKAPVFKVPKLPKPKVNDLRKALKGYVSASITERLNALSAAVSWYEDAVLYVMSKPDLVPQLGSDGFKKAQEKLEKLRKHSEGTTILEERDAALRAMIRVMEGICKKLELPELSHYASKLEARKEIFDSRTTHLQAKFGGSLEIVAKALGIPFDIRYCDDCQAYRPAALLLGCEKHNIHKVQLALEKLAVEKRDVERRLNPGLRTYFFNQNAAKALLVGMKREGTVPVLFRELRTLGRQAAAEQAVHDDKWIVGRDKLLAIWEQGMVNLEKWMKSGESPYKMFRLPQVQVASGEKKKRVSAGGGVGFGKGHLGPFMMKVLDALKDGKAHSTDELSKLVMNPHLKIDRLIAAGHQISKLEGGKYQLQKGEKK